MWYIAFTLGFFGSLHCLGMCGPLAIAFSIGKENTKLQNFWRAISYNIGRTFSYGLLGVIFGAVGSMIYLTQFQKVFSVLLGSVLILSFLLSIDLEKRILRGKLLFTYYTKVRQLISGMVAQTEKYHPFQLGMANGLLPCGLVYLALAGALATSSIWQGAVFMILFGLGTIPTLLVLVLGIDSFSFTTMRKVKKILPLVSLVFGCFLVYRGVMVDMPAELDFWESLKNPIMCH